MTIDTNCNCSCWANIVYNYVVSPRLVLYTTNCKGSTFSWEYFNGSDWETVQLGNTTLHWTKEGMYRVKVSKLGCCDAYSNIEITYQI